MPSSFSDGLSWQSHREILAGLQAAADLANDRASKAEQIKSLLEMRCAELEKELKAARAKIREGELQCLRAGLSKLRDQPSAAKRPRMDVQEAPGPPRLGGFWAEA